MSETATEYRVQNSSNSPRRDPRYPSITNKIYCALLLNHALTKGDPIEEIDSKAIAKMACQHADNLIKEINQPCTNNQTKNS